MKARLYNKIEELRTWFKWEDSIYSRRIMINEKLDCELDSYPTTNFIIKSMDICKELTTDINLN